MEVSKKRESKLANNTDTFKTESKPHKLSYWQLVPWFAVKSYDINTPVLFFSIICEQVTGLISDNDFDKLTNSEREKLHLRHRQKRNPE